MLSPSIYRLRHQDILCFCVLALLALGVLMVQSASMNIKGELGFHWNKYATQHLRFVGFALATFLLVGHIDYRFLARPRNILVHPVLWGLVIAGGACFAVLVPGIGKEINGARRWIPLGITQVQPSEIGKWAIVVFLALWLAKRPLRMENFFSFLVTLAPVGAIALLVVIEDFGTAALIGVAAVVMLIAGRARLLHLGIVLPPMMAAAYWFVRHKEYRWKRMVSFLDPWANPEKEGYHMIQSLLSFSTGGLFGTGLGRGVQKLGYLPEDTTDFIFAVICEELGLFGAMLTISLYLGILFVAWQVMKQKRDAFGQLLAFGIGTMIALQALINICVATVSVPPKGMSLPLVSYGGSGLVITCAALGMLYSVCRHDQPEVEQVGFEVETRREPMPVVALPA
jgi:cell division protein FtsW